MLARLWDAQVPIAWVVADTVSGGNLDLRNWLEAHQYPYVLAVACNEPVGILTRDGQRKRVEVWEVEMLLLGAQNWQRLSMSEGTKGPRLFDWASVAILHQWEDDGRHSLLIRRSLTDPNEKAYYARLCSKGNHLAGDGCGHWRTLAHRRRREKTLKTWGWTITKFVASLGGTDTSRWC